jgi:DNA-binding FadR family transcriptional regulator
MPLQSIEPRRLYRQIADQIRGLIQTGEFPPASRLPAERDLARQLGVSRPSVREALIALEVEGLVEVRVGSGIYVQHRSVSKPPEVPMETGPFELLRARWIIEGECAALAAKAATRQQIQGMREALDMMEEDKRRNAMPLEGDRLFHLRLAEASGNSALVLVVKTLWEQRSGPLFTQLEHHFDTPELWSAAIREHRAVVAAIGAHDAASARRAMRQHLTQAIKRFSKGWTR